MSATNFTATLVSNSTDTQVLLVGAKEMVDVLLGWGEISEVSPSGKVVKSVNIIDGNWTRVITADETAITVEYDSGPLKNDKKLRAVSDVRIVLLTVITFGAQEQSDLIKFSVNITGAWGFLDESNTLEVGFVVKSPVRTRKECDTSQNWKSTESTESSETFLVYLANDTATKLKFIKSSIIDQQPVPVKIKDPVFFANMSGWTTTIVYPSFKESLHYDPSFGLLLGYSNGHCNPLLSWILPVSFIGGAAAIIAIFLVLSYIPLTRKYIVGSKAYQIHSVRSEIKRDYKLEKQNERLQPAEQQPLPQSEPTMHLKIITNEEDLEEL